MTTNTKPRVLGILNEQPDHRLIGCSWYRCIIPLKAMEQAGFIDHTLMTVEKFNQLRGEKRLVETLAGYDAVMFQRIIETRDEAGRMNWTNGATTMRAMGIAVIADYDDDYTNEYRDVGADLPDLSAFSLVTVSTPYVRDQTLREHPNANIAVLPNMVVPSMFEGAPRAVPPLVVGLTGSKSHKNDWDVVAPVLLRVQKAVPSIRIICAGYVPDSLKDIPGLITMKELLGDAAPSEDTFVSFHQYGGIVMKNIDILLCPVDPADKFSWGRSGIKALEGMAAGAVPIVTGDVPCYAGVVQDGVNGFMVRHEDAEAWYRRIMALINDPMLRMRMKRAGRNTAHIAAASKLTAETYAKAYLAAIEHAQKPENIKAAQEKLMQLVGDREQPAAAEV